MISSTSGGINSAIWKYNCLYSFVTLFWIYAENCKDLNINKQELEILQKYHPTTSTDGTTGDDHRTKKNTGAKDNFDARDLNRLFKEDFRDNTQ